MKSIAFWKQPPSLAVRIGTMMAVATITWLAVHAAVTVVMGGDYSRGSHVVRACSIFLAAVPLTLLAAWLLDGKVALRKWGLSPLRQAWRPLLTGMAVWLVPAAAGTTACLLAGVRILTEASVGELVLTALTLIGLVFIFEAFPEELIFRGYLFSVLGEQNRPVWVSVVGSTLLFTLWGIINGGPVEFERIMLFLVMGAVLGSIRAITGSLWATIGFHVIFQATAQFFGDVGGLLAVTSGGLLTAIAFVVFPAVFSVPLARQFAKK
jgi:membrane protease YdiL (CAAX protease family)